MANLAHELRTPLQVLIGSLELLQDEYAGELGQESRAMLGRMNVKAFELKQTLDNLLSFVLAKAGGEAEFDENLTVESILDDIGPALAAANGDKRLDLRFDFKDAPAVIRAPRRAVTATIVNLALNAIRFTEAGAVTITMRRADRGTGAEVEIEVSDTGPGLNPELLEPLSRPFAQLSCSSTRRYRGVGLGLTVARRNVEMLGGSLRLRSTPGHGATFLVRLPSRVAKVESGKRGVSRLVTAPSKSDRARRTRQAAVSLSPSAGPQRVARAQPSAPARRRAEQALG
ncbi:MAG: sensor histidine kinase [Candidatus Binataceae bacterium]